MKKTLTISLLAGTILFAGCVSSYNHSRVKNNMVEKHAIASGNTKAIEFMSKGMKPVDAVKLSPTPDGQGVMLGVNILDVKGLSAYRKTFAEAPVSSTFSLLGDGVLTYFVGKTVSDEFDRGGNDTSNGGGNVDISVSGSEGTTINVDTESDTTTTTTSTDNSDNSDRSTPATE